MSLGNKSTLPGSCPSSLRLLMGVSRSETAGGTWHEAGHRERGHGRGVDPGGALGLQPEATDAAFPQGNAISTAAFLPGLWGYPLGLRGRWARAPVSWMSSTLWKVGGRWGSSQASSSSSGGSRPSWEALAGAAGSGSWRGLPRPQSWVSTGITPSHPTPRTQPPAAPPAPPRPQTPGPGSSPPGPRGPPLALGSKSFGSLDPRPW